jgi:hypothetical protein
VCPESAVHEWIVRLFRRQLETRFADLRGACAALTIPVSERLLNDILSEVLPRSGAVRDLYIHPKAGDRFQVRARLGSSTLIPPIRFHVAIDRQPDLPSSAVLVLRLEATGVMTLAGPLLRLMNALPEGVLVKDDRICVDLRTALDRHHLAQYLDYVSELRINTVENGVVLTVRGRVD